MGYRVYRVPFPLSSLSSSLKRSCLFFLLFGTYREELEMARHPLLSAPGLFLALVSSIAAQAPGYASPQVYPSRMIR
jgi:hypothetical protein